MLKFYFIGYLIAFFMLMFIFLKSEFWKEEDGVEPTVENTIKCIVGALVCVVLFSSFSWIAVIALFYKLYKEKNL